MLHLDHGLVGYDGMFGGMNFKVVLHTFYVNNFRKANPVKFVV
jgi:hypothetical protein